MTDEKDSADEFKVVDRRSFASDGSRIAPSEEGERSGKSAGEIPKIVEKPRPAPTVGAPDRSSSFAEASEDVEREPSRFETLVSYLSTTAMFQLGLLAGPGGERIPTDLSNARRTIDLIEVLNEKTEGNLTPDEAKLLEEVLYELRMTFVEMQERAASRRK